MSIRTDAAKSDSSLSISDSGVSDANLASPSGNPWLFLAACGLVMLVGIMFLAWMGTAPIHSAIGRPLPSVMLEPLCGADQPVSIQAPSSSLLVLHLWGPWSEECQAGFPAIMKLAGKMESDSKFRVLSVAFPQNLLDMQQLRLDTEAFLKEIDATIPTYVDVTGQTSMELALIMPYGSLGFPTTIVTDSGGTITHVIDGYSEQKMKELEEFLIKQLK